MMEKEIEAKIQGKQVTEIKLEIADCKDDDRMYWKGGIQGHKEKVMKLHIGDRPGYDDEGCCFNFSNNAELQMKNSQKSYLPTAMWKPMANGRMPCPGMNCSGCGTLQSKCIYPENWVTGLVVKAEKIGKAYGPKPQPDCSKSMFGKNDKHLDHFQRHLSRGEPVIVDDVLEKTRRLSWDPMVIWRAWRRIKADIGSSQDMDVINCLSECQVSMNSYQFFKGYTEGQYDSKGRPQLLKQYKWPYSDTFEERLPGHAAEFISCLPFKEVTHPHSGYLNLVAKLLKESSKLDLGPNIYITYGFPHELGAGDSVTKLQCVTADVVNVLLHSEAVTVALTPEQLLAIKKEKQEQILQMPKQSSEDKGCENLPANRFEGPHGFNNV
ncbi:histone modifying enzyme [Lithospermum erythrorhizon]|uniref:Histone modifying enzyme n=1 Tax=Lithospermum erythrorhizon TaxID=34254 RepID=A0AAV3NY40_LITER